MYLGNWWEDPNNQPPEDISGIVANAPPDLDTLNEIAAAINDDPNFSTNILNLINSKVDKETGKVLSSNDFTDFLKFKLENWTEYVHPATHPADIITETATRVFITPELKQKLIDLNNYVHPTTHSADMITETAMKVFITAEERDKLYNFDPNSLIIDVDEINETATRVFITPELKQKLIDLQTSFTTDEVSEVNDKLYFTQEERDKLEAITSGIAGIDDPNVVSALNEKVDKITGKGLSTEDFTSQEKDKLSSVEQHANYYVHPAKHSPDIIEETTDKKFLSSTMEDYWNSGPIDPTRIIQDSGHKLVSDTQINYWNSFVQGEVYANNIITDPTRRFVTDTQLEKINDLPFATFVDGGEV